MVVSIIHYNTDNYTAYIILPTTGLWNKHADFEW